MKYLIKFRKHSYEINKIETQIAIVTLFYFLKAGLIKFVMYINFSFGNGHTFALLDVFMPVLKFLANYLPIHPESIHTYEDFEREWVAHTSHQIVLISIISFNLSILVVFLQHALSKALNRCRARAQATQHAKDKLLRGQELEI